MKHVLRIAGAVLAGLLNGAMAQEAVDAERLNIELVKTLDAQGGFVSLEGTALIFTSGVNTNTQQPGYWLDIGQDPVSPALVCESLPAAWQVAIAGDHAFVCDYTKFLTVCEMRDRQWRQVAKLPMPSQTENIIIRGKLAYIANHVAGLTTVDISEPSKPSIVSNFNPGIDCDAVALWQDCAILYGHWESRLVLADVSDPAKPRQVGLYQHDPQTFNQGEMAVEKGFAYCTAVNGLVIVNVADLANPKLAKAVPLNGAATDVAVMDGHAFVACRDGIRVFDVRNPAEPAEVGRFKCPAAQLAVRRAASGAGAGYHIYVASKKGPAVVLRFSAPAVSASPAARGSAEDLAAIRKQVEKQVATLPVAAHFDQPYAGTENPKQMLDLYLPRERKGDKPLPVIVFIHGGAWKNGDRIRSAGSVLRFAQTGDYAGIAVSYRLSDEAKWPAQIHDCKAAIRWIRGNAEKFGLDPERIGVWGGSAGGHLVSLLGTSGGVKEIEGELGPFSKLSSRVTCVVNQCGPQDLTMPLMFRNGEPVTEDDALVGLFGGAVATHRAEAIVASPVTYVTKDDAPFLTIHGTKDERVDFKHAERIHAALKAAGVPTLLIPVTDGPHGFNNPELSARIAAFFERHLRGQDVPVPDAPVPHVARTPSGKP